MLNLGELKRQIDVLLAVHPELKDAPVTFLLDAIGGGLEAGHGVGYKEMVGISVKDFHGAKVITTY